MTHPRSTQAHAWSSFFTFPHTDDVSLTSLLFISCPPSSCSPTLPSPHYNIFSTFLLQSSCCTYALSVCLAPSPVQMGSGGIIGSRGFSIEKMQRSVRWIARLIDLCSVRAHANTHIQHKLPMRPCTFISILLLRGPQLSMR